MCNSLLIVSDGPVTESSILMQAPRVQIQCANFFYFLTLTLLGAPVRSRAQAQYFFLSSFWDYISPNDFGNISINFGNEIWQIQNCLQCLQICGYPNYLAVMVQHQTICSRCRGPKFKSIVFFHEDIFGSLGSHLVFIIPFGI